MTLIFRVQSCRIGVDSGVIEEEYAHVVVGEILYFFLRIYVY